MELIPVIGIETHIQLATASKLFCSCPKSDAQLPNVHTCPICLGHPGTLPVVNIEAVRSALRLGHALKGNLASVLKFDRKHYTYPDLSKSYQISQYDIPIMEHGSLHFMDDAGNPCTVTIERLHLEEDAGKNIHDASGVTYVDFSRGGSPLCEIVTGPDFHKAEHAKRYAQELRLLARMLGVSEGDMEKGHLRCDVNISLREQLPGGTLGPLMPKTEIKNINSFRAIERAILYEIERQTDLWNAGTPPLQSTTRSWNDDAGVTELRREKETSADYRYLPEPDLPVQSLARLREEVCAHTFKTPEEARTDMMRTYEISRDDADRLLERKPWLELFQQTAPLLSTDAKPLLAPWILTKLAGILDEYKKTEEAFPKPSEFGELLEDIAKHTCTPAKGREILEYLVQRPESPYAQAKSACGVEKPSQERLQATIQEVLHKHPEEVLRYRQGETKLLAFFLGQVMKATQGNAPAQETKTILLHELTKTSS